MSTVLRSYAYPNFYLPHLTFTSSSPIPAPDCPDGWVANPSNGDCYYFHDSEMNYEEAKALCKDRSQIADVVSVRDEQEQSFLTGKYSKNSQFIQVIRSKDKALCTDRNQITNVVSVRDEQEQSFLTGKYSKDSHF